MADVRGASGVPLAAAFGGVSTPTQSTPLYVDTATGDLYVLLGDTPTLVGQMPLNANTTIGQQAMAAHFTVPADRANEIMAGRSFAPTIPPAAQSPLGNSSNVIEMQSFLNLPPQARFGEATEILAFRSMSPHPLPTMWS